MASERSDFVDLTRPMQERLKVYDATKSPNDQPKNDATDPANGVPEGFIDAMIVREEVFVKEQGVALESELDEDDGRSFHFTVYASVPKKASSPDQRPHDEKMETRRRSSTSTKVPVGTIRLVPAPHAPHHGGMIETAVHKNNEIYIKLGRLAVLKPFRKAGISKLLIDTALAFAREHPDEIMPHYDASMLEAATRDGSRIDYQGLVLVHAQTGVQKVWKRHGFETDESMGTWNEEGIEHVGMWKRMKVLSDRERRGSRPIFSGVVPGGSE